MRPSEAALGPHRQGPPARVCEEPRVPAEAGRAQRSPLPSADPAPPAARAGGVSVISLRSEAPLGAGGGPGVPAAREASQGEEERSVVYFMP